MNCRVAVVEPCIFGWHGLAHTAMLLAADRREPAVNRRPHERDTSVYVTVLEDSKIHTWSDGRHVTGDVLWSLSSAAAFVRC